MTNNYKNKMMMADDLINLLRSSKKLGLEFELIISLQAQGGLRMSEIYTLNAEMIDLIGRYIYVKSNKENYIQLRRVSILGGLLTRLQAWLNLHSTFNGIIDYGFRYKLIPFNFTSGALRLGFLMHRYSQLMIPSLFAAEMGKKMCEENSARLAVLPPNEVKRWFNA